MGHGLIRRKNFCHALAMLKRGVQGAPILRKRSVRRISARPMTAFKMFCPAVPSVATDQGCAQVGHSTATDNGTDQVGGFSVSTTVPMGWTEEKPISAP